MISSHSFGKALAATSLILALQAAHAGGSYYNLGAGNTVSGVSSDGQVAAAYQSGGGYSVWTAATGIQSIGGAWQGGVASVSGNGALVSGSVIGSNGLAQAAVYNVATATWTTLGSLSSSSPDTTQSSSWGISANGNTVVGLGWLDAGTAHAVASTPSGTLQDLGSIGGNSRADGVSGNGSVVAGWVENTDGSWTGAYWRNGVYQAIVDGSGTALSQANAVSEDGTWIVGQGNSETQTWRYNTLTGQTEFLGDLNPSTNTQAATGISADGRIIVGYDRGFVPARFGTGTIWIDGLGMMNLTDYVTEQGVDLAGRTLALPLGVSADGSTFFGIDNTGSGFVVTLSAVPEPASAAFLMVGIAALAALRRRSRN